MIWKTLGFQLTAVSAVAVLLAFVAPLPRGNEPTLPAPVQPAPRPQAEAVHTAPYTPASPQPSAREGVTVVQSRMADEPVWSGGPEHDAGENAEYHWRKHGGEFPGLHNDREYIDRAHALVDHPPADAWVKQDSRGDTLIYDPQSNTFAVRAPDGAPRTMFRPHDAGAYWERRQ